MQEEEEDHLGRRDAANAVISPNECLTAVVWTGTRAAPRCPERTGMTGSAERTSPATQSNTAIRQKCRDTQAQHPSRAETTEEETHWPEDQ